MVVNKINYMISKLEVCAREEGPTSGSAETTPRRFGAWRRTQEVSINNQINPTEILTTLIRALTLGYPKLFSYSAGLFIKSFTDVIISRR